jgi:hypothetical protein
MTDESNPACPRDECGGDLSYGALLDTVTGQRGWGCDECDYAFSTGELKRKGAL